MQDLSLKSNLLGQLPAEVCANLFAGLSNLEKLNLESDTKLSELPAEVFSGLSNLQDLEPVVQLACGSCLLKSGPICFQGSATCRNSTWESNELSKLPAEVFSGLSNLQDLNLWFKLAWAVAC